MCLVGLCVSVCVFLSLFMCVSSCVYLSVSVLLCLCRFVSVCVCVSVCVLLQICTYEKVYEEKCSRTGDPRVTSLKVVALSHTSKLRNSFWFASLVKCFSGGMLLCQVLVEVVEFL